VAILVSGEFVEQFVPTITRLAYGFGLAMVIGFPVGYLMGTSRYWRAFFHDMVMVAGSIPGITYAVMALVLAGISLLGPVLSVGLVAMPYIAINVAEGLDSVDRRLVQMSDAFGRNRSKSSPSSCRRWRPSPSRAYDSRSPGLEGGTAHRVFGPRADGLIGGVRGFLIPGMLPG
jgi:hypothetical protein